MAENQHWTDVDAHSTGVAAFAISGTDTFAVARIPLARRLFREYIAKARQR